MNAIASSEWIEGHAVAQALWPALLRKAERLFPGFDN